MKEGLYERRLVWNRAGMEMASMEMAGMEMASMEIAGMEIASMEMAGMEKANMEKNILVWKKAGIKEGLYGTWLVWR